MKRVLVVILCGLSLAKTASAETAPPTDPEANEGAAKLELTKAPEGASDFFDVELDRAYLWDGGAVPFVYGSAAVAIGIRLFVSPRSTPLLFPSQEGGAVVAGDTVPEVALGLGAVAGLGLIAAIPSVGRYHHMKGYSEALLTTIALTEVVKNLVSRHRPTFQVGDTDVDLRRSFFSGHSSITAATTVYLGLYLHTHVLPRLHGPYAPAARLLTYGALAAAFVGVPYSRLHDNRHHLSDVTTGAFVGSAMAVSFYAYQESRLLRSEEDFYRGKRQRMLIVPDLQNRGLSLVTRW